ncbi:hypothetical protein VKT23_019778 [Stygiomarasmius scandens]|uniref:ABM domain-containing protein n=1 Tax=Marasmiellus scandens TaxID=2682957 RepID=A0ABR1IKH7_9AGAR
MAENLPERTSSGKLMILVRIKVKPGKETRFEELATASKLSADSDKEPGVLTYRVTRVVDKDAKPTGEYVAIEEYAGKAEVLTHLQAPAYLELMKEASEVLEDAPAIEVIDEF